MDQQNPQDPNKIDLSSVNQQPKQKKQLKLPSFLQRNRSAGPGRDHLGQFASGSTGFKSVKKFNWSRAVPLILIVSAVGGYLVFRSFAGTDKYSWRRCSPNYIETCMNESVEAAISRLYVGILGRPADKNGLEYWSRQVIQSNKLYSQVADSFLGSAEGERRYGTTTNKQYVQRLYSNVLSRSPTSKELSYWEGRLTAKTSTRGQVAVLFTGSSENMEKQYVTTLNTLEKIYDTEIPYNVSSKLYASYDIGGKDKSLCIGRIVQDSVSHQPVCSITAKETTNSIYEDILTVPNITLDPGEYLVRIKSRSQAHIVGRALLTDGDSDKIVTNSRTGFGDAFPKDFYLYTSSSLESSDLNMVVNTTSPIAGASLKLYLKDFTKMDLKEVAFYKVTRTADRQFLSNSELTLTGYTKAFSRGTLTVHNPPSIEADSEYYRCYKGTSCTSTVKATLPKGKYRFYYATGWILGGEQGTLDLKVARTDTGNLISSREAWYADPTLENVSRKTTLPITLNKNGNSDFGNVASVEFTLDTAREVQLTAVNRVTEGNFSLDYFGVYVTK